MFTIIIAEKDFIEKVDSYNLFLHPFLKNKNVAFCEWNKEAASVSEMLPTLTGTVARRDEWRAVIVCDESGLNKHNPFDVVEFACDAKLPSEYDEDNYDEIYEEYLDAIHNAKLEAYKMASKNPLTRLVTFLCESPTVTKKSEELSSDPAYNRYFAEVTEKELLRKKIKEDQFFPVSSPKEVICIAKRTCQNTPHDFELAWASHSENEYSRFYDRNMYFDKMRYLVFDILPKDQNNYSFDYVRFIYGTLLLASNELPAGSFAANRVYMLDCDTDEDSLKKLLFTYQAKLDMTIEMLNLKIKDIKSKRPAKLSDREASQIFCGKVNIPVTIASDFDKSELFVETNTPGLSRNCPAEEEYVWDGAYSRSKKALHRFLKQARRSLSRATKNCSGNDLQELDKVGLLNEFQLDDVKEHISNEELAMLSMDLPNLYDEEGYIKTLDKEDAKIKDEIAKRMSKRATVTVSALAIAAYIIGFFTLFFINASSNVFNFSFALLMFAVATGIFALIALITVLIFRFKMVGKLKQYNKTMYDVDAEIGGSMAEYSKFLGHVCNVRRGFSVLSASENSIDPDGVKITLYRKHILDMEKAKAESKDVFGHFLSEPFDYDFSGLCEYDYNFDRAVEYSYPLPYSEKVSCLIEFMHTGNSVSVPVDFVKKFTVRREELYE